MDQKKIEQYLKIKAHVDRNTGNEKENAQKVLSKMETDYPGIRAAAEARGRAATPPDPFATPPPGPGKGGSAFHPGPAGAAGARGGNWENIFQFAQGFYKTAKTVVNDAANAYYGRVLAEGDIDVTAGTRDRHVFIRMKVPFETMVEARKLNNLQKEEFRQALHEMIDEYIEALINPEQSV